MYPRRVGGECEEWVSSLAIRMPWRGGVVVGVRGGEGSSAWEC